MVKMTCRRIIVAFPSLVSFLLLTLTLMTAEVSAQMLLTEGLTNVIDTSRRIQGSIAPEIGFRTEKKEVFTLKNTANINIMVGRQRALTILNKLELNTYGRQLQVSDGYIHVEYRNLLRPYIEIYPYTEAQWAGSRGMQIRGILGAQTRLRLIQKEHLVWTTGAGFFYEFEKWEDKSITDGKNEALTHNAKVQIFASVRLALGQALELVTSGYYQGALNEKFLVPRVAVGVDLKYKLTSHFALWGSYAFFYDEDPPIKISKPYTTLTSGVQISF